MHIPGAILFRCEMSNPHARLQDMQMLRPCVVSSLRRGDDAYIHCVSGITRAPMAAAVLSAMLMGITLDEAKNIINQTRNVSFHSGRNLDGAWIPKLLREGWHGLLLVEPTGFSCSAARTTNKVVHATTIIVGNKATNKTPVCRWRDPNTGDQDLTLTATSIEQAASQFGGRFCASCKSLLRASLQLQVKHSYS